jgi:hypothetical protein
LKQLNDPDVCRFERELAGTCAGLHLRLAMTEGRIAIAKIRTYRAAAGAIIDRGSESYRLLELWRRAYIKACNAGSAAIAELWQDHQWPSEGAHAAQFAWEPKEPLK